jgi:hypothetical protein
MELALNPHFSTQLSLRSDQPPLDLVPTAENIREFGLMLQKHMVTNHQPAFQAFPCVMPVFLELVFNKEL